MEITEMEIIPLEIPITFRREFGAGSLKKIENIIVKLTTNNGLIGIGEASPWEVFGENSRSAYVILRDYLKPAVVGENPLNVEKIMSKFNSILVGGNFSKAAVEIALYDLIGKYFKTPLYNILGGKYRDKVQLSYSVSAQDVEIEIDEISNMIQNGVSLFKIKTGVLPHKQDMKRMEKIAEVIEKSNYAALRIDYNQGIKRECALRHVRDMESFLPDYIEQPVSSWDIDAMAHITQNVGTPISADESAFTIHDAMSVVKMKAADIISVKIMKCGGIKNAQKIAGITEAANIPCFSGLMWESSIGFSAAMHLALATKNISYGGDYYIPYFLMKEDIVKKPHPYKDGFIRPNDEYGLGVELDEKVINKFTIAPSKYT